MPRITIDGKLAQIKSPFFLAAKKSLEDHAITTVKFKSEPWNTYMSSQKIKTNNTCLTAEYDGKILRFSTISELIEQPSNLRHILLSMQNYLRISEVISLELAEVYSLLGMPIIAQVTHRVEADKEYYFPIPGIIYNDEFAGISSTKTRTLDEAKTYIDAIVKSYIEKNYQGLQPFPNRKLRTISSRIDA